MSVKKETRLRRARKARLKMRELETVRLCVYRSSQHIYAQVLSADGGKVLASASTLDKELRDAATGNVVIRHFENPAPSRVIALVWRGSSALSGFLREMTACFKDLPPGLLEPGFENHD